MKSMAQLMRALYEEILFSHYATPPKFLSNQAPYRFTREYGKRSNWIKQKQRKHR